MAEIRPFRGVFYNQRLVGDLSAIICPPYDVITPQMQDGLYRQSGYNFVRVEFNRELPQDTADDNRYTRAAATLEQWLAQGVLEVDAAPAIYLHDHYFAHQGREYRRRGITACVRLEEWDKLVIRPHESMLSKPKSDRLSLLWACQANTSPILTLFDDPEREVSSLLAMQESNQPIISLNSATGEGHKVWAITQPEIIGQIQSRLAHQPLYIADGHHRYQSALIYLSERRAQTSAISGDEAYSFVMMTLVDFSDPGLIILPPHRLVRGISRPSFNGLMAQLKVFFEIEELPMSMPGIWQRVDDLLAGGGRGKVNRPGLVVFGLVAERLLVLRLRDFTAASQMMPYFHGELYKSLDVSLVDHIILEKLLGISEDREEVVLAYSYDRLEAVGRVLSQEYQLAFLLNPIEPKLVRAIADTGDRLPRKSTYFYPKVPAGLVLNRLV